ncbi:hypothetical protein D3C73_471590 [compost metagenome]
MGQGLKNQLHVAHGNALANQALQHFGNLLHGDVAIDFLEQIGTAGFHFVEQLLGFLHAKKLLDVARQQGDQAAVAFLVRRAQVIAQLLHPFLVVGVDPHPAQAIAVTAVHQGKAHGFQLRRVVEQSPVIEMDIELLGAHFVDQYRHLMRRQGIAGAQLRLGNAQPVIDKKLTAKTRRPTGRVQLVEARRGHQQHQRDGFSGDVIDVLEQARAGLHGLALRRRWTAVTLPLGPGGLAPANEYQQCQGRGDGQESQQRKTGQQADAHRQQRRHPQHEGMTEHLGEHVAPQVGVIAVDAGDDEAGADGDQQRRNLCHQTIADGQQGVGRQGGGQVHAHLPDANGHAADEVDEDNDDAGDGIALDELHRAVERAVQLAFALQHAAFFLGFLGRHGAGLEVAVDAHLLAGHAVQREARRDFGHPLRTLGDHDELDNSDNGKDHEAHHQAFADHELTEGGDDLPRISLAEDQPAGADRQRQAEQGGQQQQRRKGRETEDAFDVERPHEHQQRNHDVQADEKIHQRRRQGNDQHGDDHHHQRQDQQLRTSADVA